MHIEICINCTKISGTSLKIMLSAFIITEFDIYYLFVHIKWQTLLSYKYE